MNFILSVNYLIKHNSGESIERILWIDEYYTDCFTLDVYASTGFPKLKKISDILSDIEMEIAVIYEKDPYVYIDEDSIKEEEKELRDKKWKFICSLVEDEPNIFFPSYRGQAVKKVVFENDITTKSINKYMRRYWQRGKNKNALLPDDYKKGGKGKEKKV